MKQHEKELKKRLKVSESRIWQQDLFSMNDLFKSDIVLFKSVRGLLVPLSPWPVKFFTTSYLLEQDGTIIQPLTLTRFVVYIIQNFISMNFWRIKILFYNIGFLEHDDPSESLSFKKDWRWNIFTVKRKRKLSMKLYRGQFKLEDYMEELCQKKEKKQQN